MEIEISDVNGLYDDTEGFKDSVPIVKRAIRSEILNDVILQDKEIQRIDLALGKILKNNNGTLKGKNNTKESELDDNANEYDEDNDGNEWPKGV